MIDNENVEWSLCYDCPVYKGEKYCPCLCNALDFNGYDADSTDEVSECTNFKYDD